MFEKINYITLLLLVAAISCLIYQSGNANWKEEPARDFYKMGYQTNVSEKEKLARLKKIFGAVEELIDEGRLEQAQLTLSQLEAKFKGDGHLYFLRGKILATMEMHEKAILNFIKAVKLDPDYIDERCTLTYKGSFIEDATNAALKYYKGKKDDESKKAMRAVRNMQRRLAGSCE